MEPTNKLHNKLLIVGANGMLGQALATTCNDYEPLLWDKTEIDITNADQVMSLVEEAQPTHIINAAAYTAVDKCEDSVDIAMQVNGEGPRNLANAAKAVGAVLVHYSTDYIFNGEKQDGYPEDFNQINPVNQYGKSKAAGEVAIQEIADDTWNKYYIIRTAWLYGPGGVNFVDTMRKLGREKDHLSVVNDQHGSPTYTKDLAERTKWMIEQKPNYGVYHVTNAGTCTWYEFAQEIFRITNSPVKLSPCTSAEFPRPAKRPAFSILLNTKFPPMRPWQAALRAYITTES